MPRPLTIAHIIDSYGMGGAERVALDLASIQRQEGHRVLAVSLSDDPTGPLVNSFRQADVEVHNVAKRDGIDLTLTPRLTRFLKEQEVDVVHTHNSLPVIYAPIAGRLLRCAVVHTKHGEGHRVTNVSKFLRRLTSPFAHYFVAVSEGTAAQAKEQWDDLWTRRIKVIPNGIRLERFHPDTQARQIVRGELGIPESALVVGTVGRMDDNKNQLALVRATANLLGPTTHLILVGTGPMLPQIREAVLALPARDSVHILGRRDDANRVMAAMDVFALPSLSEGLPLVILEAMATQLPVVSTNVGGIGDVIVHNETGILVPPNNDKAMERQLKTLLTDNELAKRLGNAGRESVLATYSAERMADDYMKLYRAALS